MLVGRSGELRLLADLQARQQPVVVAGEAGVGKTTLLQAAAAGRRQVFAGGGLATLSWMDCLPLRRAIGQPLVAGDAQAAAAQVLRAVGDGILLVDDLQWADPVTIDAILLLAGRCRLLTAVRRGDPAAGAVLDRLADAGFAAVDLAPLAAAQSAELIRDARPGLPDRAVARLVRRAGGNPLLLLELARTGEPSASLRLLLAARLRALDVAGKESFGLLALAGRPLPAGQLGTAGSKSLLEAELAIAERGELTLRHALFAEVADDAFSADELRALHAVLARAMSDPGEAARHYAKAAEPERALEAALAAAATTSRPGERASHLAVAASVAAGPAADELRMRAARALDEAHDWPGVVSVLGQVTSDDPELRAWSQLLLARGAWAAGDLDSLRGALASGLALAAGTGSEVEVRLRIEQSRLPIFVDVDLAEGVRMTKEALSLARRREVAVPRAEYLYGTALAIADLPGGGEHLAAALAGARDTADVDTEFLAANNLISYHESGGSPGEARSVAETMTSRAAALGLGYWESGMRAAIVNLDVNAGRYAQAITAAQELLELPLESRSRDMLVEGLGIALIDVGRVDEAARLVTAGRDSAAPDYKGQGQLLWVMAEAALWGGRPARALELIAGFLDGPAGDPNQLFGWVTRAWARAELGEDPGPAAPAHERPMLRAARPETDGLRLLYLGEHAAASGQFELAAPLWAPYHRRGALRCAWASGEALRRGGDLAGAVSKLEAAEQSATGLGAAMFLARIHRSLRLAGQHRSAPRSGRRGGLTGRERQVLELVRAGLTNAEIAARLGITQRTVVALINSASATLGAANRSHAAALAAQG